MLAAPNQKEWESHLNGLSVEQRSLIMAAELPGRLHTKVKLRNGDTMPHSTIPPPPPLPTSTLVVSSTGGSSTDGSSTGGSSGKDKNKNKEADLSGDWFGKSEAKKAPAAGAAEKAQVQVLAYRTEALPSAVLQEGVWTTTQLQQSPRSIETCLAHLSFLPAVSSRYPSYSQYGISATLSNQCNFITVLDSARPGLSNARASD
jgi:hypothetical protein